MQRERIYLMILVFAVCELASFTAKANMSYTPWIHRIVANGEDVEITVNVFDEIEGVALTGDTLPDLTAAYTLGWNGYQGAAAVVFTDRIFDPEDAIEVTDFGCHTWYHPSYDDEYDDDGPEGIVDCDDDGVEECSGFCAVAYRFKVIEHCPEYGDEIVDGYLYYYMRSDPWCDAGNEGGGLGYSNWMSGIDGTNICDDEEDTDDTDTPDSAEDTDTDETNSADDDGDSGCSVSRVGSTNRPDLLQTMLSFFR